MTVKEAATIDGIFDVMSDSEADILKETRVADGKLISMEQKDLRYDSTAIFTDRSKKISGIYLQIENNRGKQTVQFPKEFSLEEVTAMLNQQVRYLIDSWSTMTEGTLLTYGLDIKTGKLKGQKYEEKVFS